MINQALATPYLHPHWKHAKIVFIPKKDGTRRPISITSIILLEYLWLSEAQIFSSTCNVFRHFQVGFRPKEGVFGPISAVDLHLRLAKQHRRQAVVAALDLTSAYCKVSRNLLLEKFTSHRPPQWMTNFLQEHLTGRTFQCSMAGLLGPIGVQNRGVPQGSIISPFLFNWFLSDFPSPDGVNVLLYADDILIIAADDALERALHRCQVYMDNISLWCETNHMEINPAKSGVLIPFQKNEPSLSLNVGGASIPFVSQISYLGVILAKNLRPIAHIERNILKTQRLVAHFATLLKRYRGAFIHQKLFLYKQYIRPRLEYGCCLLKRSAMANRLLDMAERRILRMLLGAPATTNSSALYLQSGIQPISQRQALLSLRLCFKVITSSLCQQFHPIHQQGSPLDLLNSNNWSTTNAPAFVQHYDQVAAFMSHFPVYCILDTYEPLDLFLLDLVPSKKSSKVQFTSWNHFFCKRLRLKFPGRCLWVATDGSVIGCKAACAFITSSVTFACRLPDFTSPFEAECMGIDAALTSLLRQTVTGAFDALLFLTDCRSLMSYLRAGPIDVDRALLWKSINALRVIVPIFFVWIPSHVEFKPNEEADKAAKRALHFPQRPDLYPSAVYLPRFVCARHDRRMRYTDRTERLRQVLPRYTHLQHMIPSHRYNPFTSQVIDWIWTRFRLNRPPSKVLHLRFAAYSGYCLHCPTEEFSLEHLLFSCPRFSCESRNFLSELCRTLNVSQVPLHAVLTCGASINPSYTSQVASLFSSFFLRLLH